MKWRALLLVWVGLLLVFPPNGLAEQSGGVIQSIRFEPDADGSEDIYFQLSGAHTPKIFTLGGGKPRLVLDFHDLDYTGKAQIAVKDSQLVQNIRIGVHREPKLKTRVVIDLTTQRKVSHLKDFLSAENILKISLVAVAAETSPVAVQSGTSGAIVEDGANSAEKSPTPAPEDGMHSVSGQPGTAKDAVAAEKSIATIEKAYSPADPLLMEVSFDDSSNKGEMVQFRLNDFYPPVVSAIEQGTPRVVCDFINMRMAREVPSLIEAKGMYIDKIRVARHIDPMKVRVVLDLVPSRNYDLQQVFFKDENLFVLIVNVLGDDSVKAGSE